ncbi:uncharacterized protein TNCV_1284481 [Trichonephila clavipes]|uniref:HTH CENPB-type domain-containing protein n=1 Tax=Trichonephila clavipes TaxID=2585209 RepID=A0A8X6VP52_TRICX|nr:uncharacterized protein TNCV_1284481 [Trichonephila clavipes]
MEMDYNKVINDFAMIKAQRKPLLYKYNDSDPTKMSTYHAKGTTCLLYKVLVLKTISEKKKVIESVEEGERKVDVAKAFEILLSSLSTILKNKEKIFSASSSRVIKRVSKGNFPCLEQCLISWMSQCREQNIPMGGSLLKEKAKAFAKEIGIEFSASEGWLTNFKKRNGIDSLQKNVRGKLKCRH